MIEQAQAIFDENILAVLATVNEDGSPWATPVHVVTDGEAVYWFSREDTAHSQNIARDGRASITLFSPDTSRGPKGVYLNGTAELLSGERRIEVYALFQGRLGSVPSVFDDASAYRLPLGVYSDEKSTENRWYFYS